MSKWVLLMVVVVLVACQSEAAGDNVEVKRKRIKLSAMRKAPGTEYRSAQNFGFQDPYHLTTGARYPDCAGARGNGGELISGGGIRATVLSLATLRAKQSYMYPGTDRSVADYTRIQGAISGGAWGLVAALGIDFDYERALNTLREACAASTATLFRHKEMGTDGQEKIQAEKEDIASQVFGDTQQQGSSQNVCAATSQACLRQAARKLNGGQDMRQTCRGTCDEFHKFASVCFKQSSCHDEWTNTHFSIFKRFWKRAMCSVDDDGEPDARTQEYARNPGRRASFNVKDENSKCYFGWQKALINRIENCEIPTPVFSANIWHHAAMTRANSDPDQKGSGGPVRFNYGGIDFFKAIPTTQRPMYRGRPTGATAAYDQNPVSVRIANVRQYKKVHGRKQRFRALTLNDEVSYSSSAWAQTRVTGQGKGTGPTGLYLLPPEKTVDNVSWDDMKNMRDQLFGDEEPMAGSWLGRRGLTGHYYRTKMADSGAYSNLAFHTLLSTPDADFPPLDRIIAFDFGDNHEHPDHMSYELKRSFKWHFGVDLDIAASRARDKRDEARKQVVFKCATWDKNSVTAAEPQGRFGDIHDCPDRNHQNLVYAKINVPMLFASLEHVWGHEHQTVMNLARLGGWQDIYYFPMRGLFTGRDGGSKYIGSVFGTVGGNAGIHNTNMLQFLHAYEPNFFKCRDKEAGEQEWSVFQIMAAADRFYMLAFRAAGFEPVRGQQVPEYQPATPVQRTPHDCPDAATATVSEMSYSPSSSGSQDFPLESPLGVRDREETLSWRAFNSEGPPVLWSPSTSALRSRNGLTPRSDSSSLFSWTPSSTGSSHGTAFPPVSPSSRPGPSSRPARRPASGSSSGSSSGSYYSTSSSGSYYSGSSSASSAGSTPRRRYRPRFKALVERLGAQGRPKTSHKVGSILSPSKKPNLPPLQIPKPPSFAVTKKPDNSRCEMPTQNTGLLVKALKHLLFEQNHKELKKWKAFGTWFPGRGDGKKPTLKCKKGQKCCCRVHTKDCLCMAQCRTGFTAGMIIKGVCQYADPRHSRMWGNLLVSKLRGMISQNPEEVQAALAVFSKLGKGKTTKTAKKPTKPTSSRTKTRPSKTQRPSKQSKKPSGHKRQNSKTTTRKRPTKKVSHSTGRRTSNQHKTKSRPSGKSKTTKGGQRHKRTSQSKRRKSTSRRK